MSDPRDAFFSVEGQKAAIGRRAGNASVLVLSASGLKFALHLAGIAIIARLVPPEQFGVAALAMPIILIATELSQFGLAEPIVQMPKISHRMVNSLFWVNLMLGGLLCLSVIGISGLAADFYNQPLAGPVFQVLAFSVLFSAISTQYVAILRRRLEFRVLETAQVLAFALTILLAILAAWAGAGYWAVVIQYGMQSVLTVALLSVLSGWRPSGPTEINLREASRMLKFGGHVAASSLIARINQSIPTLLSGRVLGTEAAGLYYRSFTIGNLMPARVLSPLSGVFVPTLSRLQDDPPAFRAMFERMITRMDLMLMPIAVILATLPDICVRIALGPTWMEAAPLLAWMSVIVLLSPAMQAGNWLLISSGASRALLVYTIISVAVVATAAITSVQYGLVAMTAAYMTTSLVVRLPCLGILLVRNTTVTWNSLLRSYGADLALALFMIFALWEVRRLAGDISDVAAVLLVGLPVAAIYTTRILVDSDMRGDLQKVAERVGRAIPRRST